MRRPMPFWVAFTLALVGTILTSMVALDIVPREPPLYAKICALAINTILWVNTVLANPLRLATPTGELIPMPPQMVTPSLVPPPGAPILPPSSHVAIVAELPDGMTLPKKAPDNDPPKGVA